VKALIDEQIKLRELARVEYHNERARKLGLPATLSLEDWLKTLQQFQWSCAYCAQPYEVLEHFIPLAMQSETSKTNCLPSCLSCNHKKQGSHPGALTWLPPSTLLYIRSYFASLTTGESIPAAPTPKQALEDKEAIYTTSDVRALLHISESTIRRWIREGKIHSTLVNGIRKFSDADISSVVPSPMNTTWFTFPEVMNKLRISEPTLRRWVKAGKIEVLQIGRQLRFEESEVKRFMDLRRRARVRQHRRA
jgi:excisionase family DNA binding protein